MRRIIRLTENDLTRLVKRVINEDKKKEMSEKEKAAYEEFENWLNTFGIKIGTSSAFDGNDELQVFIKKNEKNKELPILEEYQKLKFNDGYSLMIKIIEHDGWNGISILSDEYGNHEDISGEDILEIIINHYGIAY
jgi:hypothetical protein